MACRGDVIDTGAGRIEIIKVGGWRNGALAQGENGDDGFEGAGGAEQVAVQRLGGADRQPLGVLAEDAAQGVDFDRITFRRRRAVGVDVVDVGGVSVGRRPALR